MSPPHLAAPAFAGVTMNAWLRTATRAGITIALTEGEYQMFELLIAQPIVTVQEFSKLAQRADGISKSTVRGYVANLRRKLRPIGLAVDAYYGRGLALREL